MKLRSSTDFVGPLTNHKKPSKFLEIFGTVAVTVITATVTIYGYHITNTAKVSEKIFDHELENKKIDMDLSKTVLQLQEKRLDELENGVKAARIELDVWREKYYKVIEDRSTLLEKIRLLQEKCDKLEKDYETLKQALNK